MLAFLEFSGVHGGVQCAAAAAGHAIAEKRLPEWLVEVQVLSGLLSAEIVQKYPHRAAQWKI